MVSTQARIASGTAPCARQGRTRCSSFYVEHLAGAKGGQIFGRSKKELLELGRTMMVDAKSCFWTTGRCRVNRTLLNTIGDAIIRLNRTRLYFRRDRNTTWILWPLCVIRDLYGEGKFWLKDPPKSKQGASDRGLSGHRAQEQGWLSA